MEKTAIIRLPIRPKRELRKLLTILRSRIPFTFSLRNSSRLGALVRSALYWSYIPSAQCRGRSRRSTRRSESIWESLFASLATMGTNSLKNPNTSAQIRIRTRRAERPSGILNFQILILPSNTTRGLNMSESTAATSM